VALADPAIDVLEPTFAGAGSGAIDARPVVLSRDLVLESEVRAVVAGVPVRGVDALELAEDMPFVGDFDGDCSSMLACPQPCHSTVSTHNHR
jgi:hypothetical protein